VGPAGSCSLRGCALCGGEPGPATGGCAGLRGDEGGWAGACDVALGPQRGTAALGPCGVAGGPWGRRGTPACGAAARASLEFGAGEPGACEGSGARSEPHLLQGGEERRCLDAGRGGQPAGHKARRRWSETSAYELRWEPGPRLDDKALDLLVDLSHGGS